MKKNTLKVLALMMALAGFSPLAKAQTPPRNEHTLKHTDTKKLQELAVKFQQEYEAKRAEAVRLAEINNWPVDFEKDGVISSLVDVYEGKPVYLKTDNAGSAITSRANYLQPGGGLGLNLTGSTMYVGMWDGGYPRMSHNDFNGRVLGGDAGSSEAFHPTHVLGTIMGYSPSTPEATGMAYEAFAYVFNFNNDIAEMAIQAGTMPVTNHSYGADVSQVPSSYLGSYLSEAQGIDDLTFGAKNYVPVFSAGNDGNGTYDRLTDRTLAKNALAVGAVFEVQNYTGPGSVSLASFSSWGPTNDNRVKPDIVTKGVQVYSASNTSNSAHAYSQGTSMSAPGITGTLVLLQEYWSMLHNGDYMWSSTLRGLASHTADDAGNAGPDPKFGWGLMNAKDAAEAITNNGNTSSIKQQTLYPGEEYSIMVKAQGGSMPLEATLAWTDPPGNTTSSSASVLVNDLDIRVTKGSTIYYPYKLASNPDSPAITGDNAVDNIEKVAIAAATTGDWYTITVSHKGNTLFNPGTGAVPSQEYSLIITGIDDETADVADVDTSIFNVWPNPANDVLNITLSGAVNGKASVTMFDVQGRQVIHQGLNAIENAVNVSALSQGMYMVTVTNGEQSSVKKVFVQ